MGGGSNENDEKYQIFLNIIAIATGIARAHPVDRCDGVYGGVAIVVMRERMVVVVGWKREEGAPGFMDIY